MKIIFGKSRRIAFFLLSCFICWTFLRDYDTIQKSQRIIKEQNGYNKHSHENYRHHLDNNITSNVPLQSKLKQFTKSPKVRIRKLQKNKESHVQKKTIIPILKDDYGEGVYVEVVKLPPEERAKYHRLFARNSFSEYTSDLISVNRTLPDSRPQACKDKSYFSNLLQTSVIITFYNEARSALLRSVHSVINRSPPSLLKEIILVDDASDREDLKAPLDEYLKDFPLVKLIRCQKREGLIRARILGFQHATAPVATFLDSHIECTPGWLQPLLEPITKDKTVVTFPRIGYINKYQFKYNMALLLHYGIFRWRALNFDWGYIPKQILDSRKSEADNIKSPTMPGGLFSISKEYFTSLGTFDPKLEGWGGENLELSFKSDLDVRERIELRKKLQCKSFEWYYRNVLSISLWTPVDALLVGQIFSLYKPGLCIDRLDGSFVKLYTCNSGVIGNQNFYFTKDGMIRTEGRAENMCITGSGISVTFQECDVSSLHQKWNYQINQFQQLQMKTCLGVDVGDLLGPITMLPCNNTLRTRWQMNPRSTKPDGQ